MNPEQRWVTIKLTSPLLNGGSVLEISPVPFDDADWQELSDRIPGQR